MGWEGYAVRTVLRQMSAPLKAAILVRRVCRASEDLSPTESDSEAWVRMQFEAAEQEDGGLYAWLAQEACHEALFAFLEIESALQVDYADALAQTMVGLPLIVRRGICRNLDDEIYERHSESFAEMRNALELQVARDVLLALVALPQHRLKALGYLGAIEAEIPWRFSELLTAAERHGVDVGDLAFLSEHVEGDAEHAANWLREVVEPACLEGPVAWQEVARGISIRRIVARDYWISARLACERETR